MTKDELKNIQSAITAFLREKGYTVSKSSGKYGEGYGTLSLTILSKEGGKTPEAIAFEKYAAFDGMSADWLGKTFAGAGGRRFKIAGFNVSAVKYPVIASDLQGKMFKFPVETVRNAMRREGHELPKSSFETAVENVKLTDLKDIIG